MRLCHACPQGRSSCTHAMEARDAGNNQQSDASGVEDLINGLCRRGHLRTNVVYSRAPRPRVPSERSQALHATFLTAAKIGRKVDRPSPPSCRTCGAPRPSNVPIRRLKGDIEFGACSVESLVQQWWFHKCKWV